MFVESVLGRVHAGLGSGPLHPGTGKTKNVKNLMLEFASDEARSSTLCIDLYPDSVDLFFFQIW